MEGAGVAVAFFTLFDNVVQAVHLFYVARNADRDAETCHVKLTLVQARLTHWGEATGINNLTDKTTPAYRWTEDETGTVRVTLKQMETLLHVAQQKAGSTTDTETPSHHPLWERFQKHGRLDPPSDAEGEAEAVDSSGKPNIVAKVCDKLEVVSLKRRKDKTFLQKSVWAISDRAVTERRYSSHSSVRTLGQTHSAQ
jgi:hypothetical protein